jgi:DNA-binding transcriptional MerR regulator
MDQRPGATSRAVPESAARVGAEAVSAKGATVKKSPFAFRTISEVSHVLDVPQHVLRFWETKFSQIRPMKRGGGRRYYRPEDVRLLRGVRDLLYVDGYTIKGVQKLLREGGVRVLTERAEEPPDSTPAGNPKGNAEPARAPGAALAGLDPERRAQIESVIVSLEAMRRRLRDAI